MGDTMSGFVIAGNISGAIELAVPETAGTNTLTLPARTGTVITSADTGSVTSTMLAGSIPNNKLANSTITIGGQSVALGGSIGGIGSTGAVFDVVRDIYPDQTANNGLNKITNFTVRTDTNNSFSTGLSRFTPNVAGNGTPIQFGGNSYTPYPIEIIGYSTTSDEAPARPTLNISNINKVCGMLSFALQDIIGAKVTYYRTFENYLNQSTKVSAAPLKFTIARKTAHNPAVLSFELRSPLDADRGMLPKRQMLKRDFPGLGINKVL
jgi:hypothetical protein